MPLLMWHGMKRSCELRTKHNSATVRAASLRPLTIATSCTATKENCVGPCRKLHGQMSSRPRPTVSDVIQRKGGEEVGRGGVRL